VADDSQNDDNSLSVFSEIDELEEVVPYLKKAVAADAAG